MQALFLITCGLLLFRVLTVFAVGQYYYTVFVRNYRPELSETVERKVVADDDQPDFDEMSKSKTSRKQAEVEKQGQNLYASMHVLLYTGFYRILPARDFNYQLAIGYSLECFTSIVPMFFCQVFNNAETEELTPLQSIALLVKFIVMVLIILESVILCF